jgi:S1-C subfamily serine protease
MQSVERKSGIAIEYVRRVACVLLCAAIHLPVVAIAGPIEDARNALYRGDYKTAIGIWTPLAEKGDARAQVNLGWMYAEGRGVPQSDTEAVKWYRKAAEQGDSWGQYWLGSMYEEGRGAPQNYVVAYVWCSLAAARADSDELLREVSVSGMQRTASRLTKEQLQNAQALAARWHPNISEVDPFKSTPEPKPEAEKGTPRGAARLFTGTGFFVTRGGYLLTSAHVVEGCRELKVRPLDSAAVLASVVARDPQNDLALLKAATASPAVAIFNPRRQLRLGQSIVVYGFPLSGLLSSSGNLTAGNIAALSGLGDDAGLMQVTAPIQPGNSGGPVLDSAGAVVGVVVSKLDALAVAAKIKDVPQNVNFAIKGNVATNFLESKVIDYSTSSGEKELSVEAIGELATRFTVRVECLQ